MTIWNPIIPPGRQKYLAVADALERDICDGRLSGGDQLPTHRELADQLGVTVGTVTRAYAEAERRGLTVGEVGRGTFVRTQQDGVQLHRWGIGSAADPTAIDMRHSLPPELRDIERQAFQSAFEKLLTTASSDLMRLPGDSAMTRHRDAGAEWMRRLGLSCDGDELLITCGVQHGLAVSLMTVMEPRDVLLAGEFTYPGLRSLASMLGIRLRPIALDEEGMIPDAIDRACRTEPRPTALYVVPTIQNPTCGTLSAARRQTIAEIAEKRDLIVIEDQIHALLPPERLDPIASLIADRTICLASPSKSIGPGLRVGFMKVPADLRSRLLTGISSTIWTLPPLTSEVFAIWMEDGTADRILAAKRTETAARQAIIDEYVAGLDVRRDPHANHLWLHLPDSWSERGFVRAAAERGVILPGSETFSIGRNDAHPAVRVSVGMTTREDLRRGLRILRDLLEMKETPTLTVI